jgi:4'-phosphopantetheinyl transferase
MTKGRITYSAAAITGASLSERVPHRVQSRAANALLAGLAGAVTSKSHSRSLVAAAAGDAVSLKLGIDIEWKSQHRPFDAIMKSLVPGLTCRLDAAAFYRAWTFLEAYFKAFQELPDPADIEVVAASDVRNLPQPIGNGAWALHHSVLEAFELCLVWQSPDLCAVEFLPGGAMIDTPERQT